MMQFLKLQKYLAASYASINRVQGQIADLLKIVVGDEAYFEQYLFDHQFSHRGWPGMASTVEAMPHSFDNKNISLYDLIVFELLLEIDALDSELGKNWKPLSSNLNTGSAS